MTMGTAGACIRKDPTVSGPWEPGRLVAPGGPPSIQACSTQCANRPANRFVRVIKGWSVAWQPRSPSDANFVAAMRHYNGSWNTPGEAYMRYKQTGTLDLLKECDHIVSRALAAMPSRWIWKTNLAARYARKARSSDTRCLRPIRSGC